MSATCGVSAAEDYFNCRSLTESLNRAARIADVLVGVLCQCNKG
ncbi:MAG: hypothetical protein U5K73_12195 [Halofilum sp. (in: g-proteobacteria)]|nr:hypothetical protein [Halofilum sp. (in: g-proteobacteria)]